MITDPFVKRIPFLKRFTDTLEENYSVSWLQGNLVSHDLLVDKVDILSESLLKGDWQVGKYYP